METAPDEHVKTHAQRLPIFIASIAELEKEKPAEYHFRLRMFTALSLYFEELQQEPGAHKFPISLCISHSTANFYSALFALIFRFHKPDEDKMFKVLFATLKHIQEEFKVNYTEAATKVLLSEMKERK